MKILFIVSAYSHDQLKLQPWLTIHRIGLCFKKSGHQVHILTDSKENNDLDFSLHLVDSLRDANASQILSVIEFIKPEKIIVCVSPLSLITASWYRVFEKYDACAFMSNAFYTFLEFMKAASFLSFRDFAGFGKQTLIPKLMWAPKLKRYFKSIVCQSTNTWERMQSVVGTKRNIHYIPPGIDIDLWPLKKKCVNSTDERIFLYAGSLKKIRGYEIILKAFSKIRNKDITLQILARGADEKAVEKIRNQVSDFKIRCKVDIIGGWIPPERFKGYLQGADVVLLPFVLVPSELPVTVMESIACGTPVIVSKIDGLPGAAGSAGLVVPHADVSALVGKIEEISDNDAVLEKLDYACFKVRESMKSWKSVSQNWREALGIEY